MNSLQVFVDGVGLYAPGLNGWAHARELLAQAERYQPEPLVLPAIESLPAAERRRLGLAVKLAMATGYDALALGATAADQLATVFASSAGDCDNCHQLLDALTAPERTVSPTRFHNAVHNAAAGYWSIATGSRQASTSLSAYDGGFAAGLLEAASQVCSNGQPCLLVAFDTPYPKPLQAQRSILSPFGVALLLAPRQSSHSCCSLALELTQEPAQTLSHVALENLRQHVPSARSLPLLQALATQSPAALVLQYLDGPNLAVTVQPCP